MDDEEIVGYLESLDREANEIRNDVLRLCWYMRGGITLSEAFELDVNEKKLIAELIKDNMEITKKSGMPFY